MTIQKLVMLFGLLVFASWPAKPQTLTPPPDGWDKGEHTATPVIDEDQLHASEESTPDRIQKGKNYDNMGLRLEDDGQSTKTVITSHWWVGLPALPFAKSDVVFVGTVVSAAAHLSPNRRGIYSEFRVQVEEVLINSDLASGVPGSVALDEPGGEIRFRSGRIKRVFIKGVPRVGCEYLFFARKHDDGTNFEIVTAYELSAGGVLALDRFPQFEKFNGATKSDFLALVRANAKEFLTNGRQAR